MTPLNDRVRARNILPLFEWADRHRFAPKHLQLQVYMVDANSRVHPIWREVRND